MQISFLIYNPEKHHYNSIQERAMHLARIGKAPCPFNGLDKFQGVWVRNAYMITADAFINKMLEKYPPMIYAKPFII